ncbi:hypothetical protein JYU34_002889 [Plutella xylostella]|uniref:Uncharacterized protein n=1 Tax=Plutella xylostella TaxID=51655 RepID=A0ABQ7R3F0_PLUXY|nr:hypothetical protein JYU34_002889 [Plutella xylostella]
MPHDKIDNKHLQAYHPAKNTSFYKQGSQFTARAHLVSFCEISRESRPYRERPSRRPPARDPPKLQEWSRPLRPIVEPF